MERVVVAVDGSDHAKRAVKEATRIVEDGGVIKIVYVLEYGDVQEEARLVGSPEEIEARREEVLGPVIAEMKQLSIPYEVHVLTGDPGETIAQFVERQGDAVVIGHRGLSGWKKMMLGSVSEYVLHHVTCPVVIVK
ncbi:hypothetical protein GOP80_05990 [Planococcaceae bacterium Storch 2/2-2]|nr:hypothetical protein [Planococcaceae bacterium Storch 2/2-2]